MSGSSAASGPVELVEVHTFQLEHPYVAARRAAAMAELGRDAASIAQQLHGKVSARTSMKVAGMHAWSYSIDYDGKTEELTFALRDRDEYELLCRRAQGSGDAACRRLVTSFDVE